MKTKLLRHFFAVFFILTFSVVSADTNSLQVSPVTEDRLKLFPVPDDNINYFFLQSFEKQTVVVIGDFSGLEKMIVLVVDQGCDNTVDKVIDYYPLTKIMRVRTASESRLYNTDIVKLKKDILYGAVFRDNYSDGMKSLDVLEAIVKKGDSKSVYRDVYGYKVKLFEVDEENKYSALFGFGKNADGYYLQAKTEYYRKNFRTVAQPIIRYSVYCKDTNDPVIKETVENLLKLQHEAEVNKK